MLDKKIKDGIMYLDTPGLADIKMHVQLQKH